MSTQFIAPRQVFLIERELSLLLVVQKLSVNEKAQELLIVALSDRLKSSRYRCFSILGYLFMCIHDR